MSTVNISKMCPHCHRTNTMPVEVAAHAKWVAGALIQDAFPDLSSDEREFLLTGYCPDNPACWDADTKEPEPEQYSGPPEDDIQF